MAIQATAVWRVRVAGNVNNGAGYDSGIAGAGTDYSQQDAAQATFANLSAAQNSTTLTDSSAGGLFTSAMIGNAIKIATGTNFVVGYYFITAVTDANNVVLDRAPATAGAGSAGGGKVGGAADFWQTVANNSNASGNKVVAGNTVYIRGAGSDSPGAADYTTTGFTTPPSGDTLNGRVSFIGENGRPFLSSNGLLFYIPSYCHWENLYLQATGTNGSSLHNPSGNCTHRNVVFDNNNQAIIAVLIQGAGTQLIDCEVKSGTSVPTASSSNRLVCFNGNSYSGLIQGCYIHHGRDVGVYIDVNSGVCIKDTIIQGCVSSGVQINTTSIGMTDIINCTIDGNSGNGVTVNSSTSQGFVSMTNTILSNNGGYGLSVAGNTGLWNRLHMLFDYNDYYNNTSGAYLNSAAGSNDLALDPQYTNRTATPPDFSIGTNLKAKGFPGLIKKSGSTSYVDIGAVQRQEPAGGGGPPGIIMPTYMGAIPDL